MAEIKIYGTLVNDTAEAIARTTQVIDPATGKNVNEMIADSGLTPWQKAYLEGLEKQEMADKFTATIILSQTQKDFDGTATTVTVYVTPKFDGSNVDAVVTGTSSSLYGKTFTKGSDGRYSTQVTLNAPASVSTPSITETFSVMVKYTHPTAGQLTKSLSATHKQNIKSYILKEAMDALIINDLATRFGTAWKSANSLKGTHSIPIASGGEWVFLVVPKTDNRISKVTSSGFDVPMTSVGEDVSVTKGSSTIHYMVIRTSSKPQSTPFNIVIS